MCKIIKDMPSKILEIRKETHDTKAFKLEVPKDFEFFPGQFIMLKVDMRAHPEFEVKGGKSPIQSRAYSIASSPLQKGSIELLIKKKEGGFVSVYLNDFAKVGDEVEISGPYGKFYYREGMGKNVALLAAGCGLSALMSILRYIVGKNLDVNVTLLYSARTPDDIIFWEELKELDKRENVKIVITLTRTKPEHKWKGLTGRINAEMIKENIENPKDYVYYICGMPQFLDDISAALRSLGVPGEKIKMEKW